MAGALRGEEAARAIRGRAARGDRDTGTPADPESLIRLLETDETAWVTPEGHVMFVDAMAQDGAAAGDLAVPLAAPPVPLGLSDAGLPIHHSKPGARFKFYLDFDGDFVDGRSTWGFSRNLPGYSIDNNPFHFNQEEQGVISRIWGRVAEDYAAFDIDVTTERPAELSFGNPDQRNVLWSIFTRAQSANFNFFVYGVSLFNLGYMNFGLTTPTFTFFDSIGARDYDFMADTASHEGGHMFGLLHDGLVTPTGRLEYYMGHGDGATSWAPLMGFPNRHNVTQWSAADYPGGANFSFGVPLPPQDDIAIIAGKLGFPADDVGDEPALAAALELGARHLITSAADVDVFALPPTGGGVQLVLSGYRDGGITDGGNLDIAAEIVNGAGVVIASSDDPNETTATLAASLPAGPHFLRVRASANFANYSTYGSIGQYTVTGAFFSGVAAPLPAEAMMAGRMVPVKFALLAADGPVAGPIVAVAELWADASGNASPIAAADCAADAGGKRYHCDLKLPKTLTPGQTYWIAVRYLAAGGWVTPVAGAGAPNPMAFVAR